MYAYLAALGVVSQHPASVCRFAVCLASHKADVRSCRSVIVLHFKSVPPLDPPDFEDFATLLTLQHC